MPNHNHSFTEAPPILYQVILFGWTTEHIEVERDISNVPRTVPETWERCSAPSLQFK